MEKQQRTRLTTVLVLVLVFATGVVVGMAADRGATASPMSDETRVAESGEERDEERREERQPLYAQVGEFSPDQEARIDAIVEEFRATRGAIREGWKEEYEPLERQQEAWEEEHVEPLRRKWGARFDSLVHATRSEIRAVMTDEQAQRYDSLVADWEQRRETRRRERSDGGRE